MNSNRSHITWNDSVLVQMFVNSSYWLGHKNLWQINAYMNVQVCFCFCDFLYVSRWCKRSLATPCCIETKLWGLNQLKQEQEQQTHKVQLDLQYKILNYLEGSFFPSHIFWKTCFDFFPFWFRFCQYLLPILFLDCVHDVEVKTICYNTSACTSFSVVLLKIVHYDWDHVVMVQSEFRAFRCLSDVFIDGYMF